MKYDEWLVEIRIIDYVTHVPADKKILTYERVLAESESLAKSLAFDSFYTKSKYEPVLRRKMESLKVIPIDCYAADAVKIN